MWREKTAEPLSTAWIWPETNFASLSENGKLWSRPTLMSKPKMVIFWDYSSLASLINKKTKSKKPLMPSDHKSKPSEKEWSKL